MTTHAQWQEQIEDACALAGIQHLDVLLDQAGWEHRAVPALKILSPEIPWFSLFTGTPEENLLDQAPLLMRLDLAHWQHKAWLEELLTHGAADGRVMVLISTLPFDMLSRALRALSQMTWGGQTGLLRYYDSRIFPLLMSSILTNVQRAEFLQVACYWGWLDRNDHLRWMTGTCQAHQSSVEVSPFVDLDDQQFDLIGCISDAQQLLNSGHFDYLEANQEQRFDLFYSLAVQASRENNFGSFTEYVKQHLSEALKSG